MIKLIKNKKVFKNKKILSFKQSLRGFTLIELLVVMSIIAVLAGLSVFAVRGARESARDARRKADLEHIASGIEIFKADCNYYPNASSITAGVTLTGVSPCNPVNTNVYIQTIPDDLDSAKNYVYSPQPAACSGNCTGFRLWSALEVQPTPTPMPTCGGAPSCGSVSCNYCITNP